MKKILFTLAAFVVTTITVAQTKLGDVASFRSETIDLGKLKVGNPATAVFQVKNVGKEALIIEAANPTCGCTIGDYTKSPISSGKNGEVKATYNAANVGVFTKTMTVKFAGVDEVKSITIKGEVLSEADYAKLKPASLNTSSVKGTKSATAVQKKKS